MSRPECARARELAPDLALGALDGEERADALEHVHRCPSCQAVVAELAGIADLLVQLVPEVEPPFGFDRRVLEVTRRDRRGRRRWIAAIAAVAAAAAIGAVALVRIVDAGRSTPSASAPQLHSTAMRGAGGQWVGRVVTTAATPASAAVNIDYAVPDGTYQLVVRSPVSGADVIGAMTVREGRGAWRGSLRGAHRPATLEMVDAAGTVVCHAALAA
jgi:Putative zinc-finger